MATREGRRLWKGFQEIVSDLSKHDVPTPSDAWMREVERFYLHPTAVQWLACVGRGGGKNLVGILCDLTELTFGTWAIPSGERHYHVHVSENREEAQKTLRQLAKYCSFLSIPHSPTIDTIDFEGDLSDRGVKVLASRVGAVSGFRSTGLTTQESAKWDNEGMNPAEEVIVSATAQTVTHKRARRRHFSTPMTHDTFFQKAVELGDTADQIVTRGPSWIFNPTITEAHTRSLATSHRTWLREYGANPQAGSGDAFDPDHVMGANVIRTNGTPAQRVLVLDFSSGKKDQTTWAIASWILDTGGADYLRLDVIEGIGGRFWDQLSGADLVTRIVTVAKEWGVHDVHADQRESFMLKSEFERHGLSFHEHPYTGTSKPRAVERVRRWLADRTISFHHERLCTELLRFEEHITPSGALTFGARGSGHDDYVCLLLTLALADLAGELPHYPAEQLGGDDLDITPSATSGFCSDTFLE